MTDYEVDVAIRKQLLLQLKVVGIDISVKAGFNLLSKAVKIIW